MPSVTLPADTAHRAPVRDAPSLAHALRDVAPRFAAILPGVMCRGDRFDAAGAPQMYLTFDDGPSEGGTPLLLQALDRHGVLATHFLLASRAARDPGLTRALLAAGHSIGNHGWRHLDAWRSGGAVDNLHRGAAWLEDALGLPVRDTRPPFGRLTRATYRWARAGNRRIALWDHMPGEFVDASTVGALAARLIRSARPGSILVLHDGPHARRAAALLDIAVPELRMRGWQFNTLGATC